MPPAQQPNYDFLNSKPEVKRRFSLPLGFDHLSGISLISILALVIIILMIVLLGSSGSAYKNELDIIARGQEIVRVSTLATQDAQDQELKDLAATVSANITSQQGQIVSYLAKHGKKTDPASQTLYRSSATDSQLTAAKQAGNLEQVYKDYIKAKLSAYQTALQQAYKSAPNSEKTILTNDFNANATLLGSL